MYVVCMNVKLGETATELLTIENPPNSGEFRSGNADDTRHFGVEFGLTGSVALNLLGDDELTLRFVYNYTDFEFRGDPGPEYLNPMGTVHGGWAMTLLDSALGCAVHSVMERGERYASLGTEVKFLRPILPTTGQVRCIGVLISRGRRTATSEGRIEDQRGRILATGTSTCFITPAGER